MPLFHKSLYVHLVVVSVRALGWTIKLTLCRQTINAILKEVVSAERSRPVLVDKENSRKPKLKEGLIPNSNSIPASFAITRLLIICIFTLALAHCKVNVVIVACWSKVAVFSIKGQSGKIVLTLSPV